MVLNLVSPDRLDAETIFRLEQALRREVDGTMTLDVRYLEEIPRTAAGKHRFVIGLPPQ
jgi:hypothetical protein